MTAMITALDSSRKEVEALKVANYNKTTSKNSSNINSSNINSSNINSSSNIKERLRKALQDIKDYELYKNVMEAAGKE